MALQYVGGNSATGTNSNFTVDLTDLTGGIATAAAEGDIVIVCTGNVSTTDRDVGVVTADYTEEADLNAADSRDANMAVAWKIMGATPDTSVECLASASATEAAVAVVHVWRGVDTGTPMDAAVTTTTGINGATPDGPAITPVTAGAVVVTMALACGASAYTGMTAPDGYGNQVDDTLDATIASAAAIASKAWGGSGAEDPAAWGSWTLDSVGDGFCAATLALRPATGGGGGDPEGGMIGSKLLGGGLLITGVLVR